MIGMGLPRLGRRTGAIRFAVQLDQPIADGVANERRHRCDVEPAHGPSTMRLDGLDAKIENTALSLLLCPWKMSWTTMRSRGDKAVVAV